MVLARVRPLVFALLAALLAACGDAAPSLSAEQRDQVRTRVAAEYAEGSVGTARERFEPLLREEPSTEDLFWGAVLAAHHAVKDTSVDLLATQGRARELAERARERAPDDARVAFVLGNLALAARDLERAEALFREVVAAYPGEPTGWLQLAAALDAQDRVDDAEQVYRRVLELDLPVDSPLRYTANFRLSRLLIHSGREEEGLALEARNQAAKAAVKEQSGDDLKGATVEDLEFGALTELRPPAPRGLAPGAPSDPTPPALTELARLPLDARGGLRLLDLDDDGHMDLLAVGADGRARFALGGDGRAFRVVESELLLPDGLAGLHVTDVDADGRRELLVRRADEAGGHVTELLSPRLDGERLGFERSALPASPARAVLTELDADGDLDLVGLLPHATLDGTRLALLSHAGDGSYVDRSAEAGLAELRADRVWAQDLDGDNDVDLLLEVDGALRALDNRRGLRFVDATAAWNPPSRAPADGRLAFADLDADGGTAIVLQQGADVVLREGGRLVFAPWEPATRDDGAGGGFGAVRELAALPAGTTRWELLDLDLDGQLDLLADHDGGVSWQRGPLVLRDPPQRWVPVDGLTPGWAGGDLLGVDVDPEPLPADDGEGDGERPQRPPRAGAGDGLRELLLVDGAGLRVLRAAPAHPSGGLSLELQGTTDNSLGVDALVEWRAGDHYGRLVYDGTRTLLGLPEGRAVDVLAVTWPNGIQSHRFDLPAGSGIVEQQPERAGGSCPFLYTFDGERWVFVTDVLGATPLGLPFAPGRMVPFDHEESVKIEADQLRPVNGVVTLALTEELREVTYLDLARLRAVDHPSHVELQPDEGFVLPPFPPPGVHALETLLPPSRAVANRAGAAGDDFAGYGAVDRAPGETHLGRRPLAPEQEVTSALAALDTQVARPFTLLPLQFQGLTQPWSLDLEFGGSAAARAAIAAAPRLRLVLTGWLQWGDASVNVAAAEHPDHAYELPVLWRPSAGGWERLPKPIGFPAGKTKTLVVDVTDFLDRSDPRLRITTTLELSWDRVALAVDAGDAPWRAHALPTLSAQLAFRGVSQMVETGRADLPELFDWERIDPHPPWNQHPGRYTRYGAVDPLLTEVDDAFVILGTGDALTLRFDASGLPALPDGWTRSWLLDLDGWAKDGDFNTVGGERVGPLPFHGMSGYPPAGDDVGPERGDWEAEWNTRGARRLVPAVAGG